MKNIHVIGKELFITSDEDIKDGDWYYDSFLKEISRANDTFAHKCGEQLFTYDNKYVRKIIITTDQDLINDRVQGIDDKFLEWFAQNPTCEEVEIEEIHLCTQTGLPCGMQCLSEETCNENIEYKIIIPKKKSKKIYEMPLAINDLGKTCINTKEEPKQEHCDCRRAYKEALSGICELCWDEKYPTKQETLEEGYERIYNSMDFTEFDFASFKLGTKWQQEQVIQLLKDNDYENEAVFDFLTEEFFNQNKKK